eukprot:1480900-Lingulodinium_polyedra.AAC.1
MTLQVSRAHDVPVEQETVAIDPATDLPASAYVAGPSVSVEASVLYCISGRCPGARSQLWRGPGSAL